MMFWRASTQTFYYKSIYTLDKSSKKEFLRSQVAAFGSTTIDYLTVIVLTELFGLWYIYSNIIGAALGAISNFIIGRQWTFKAQNGAIGNQAFRYALVSGGSVYLNTLGLYLLTEKGGINYLLAKVVVGIFVAICFNYLLQKYFVFRK